MKRNVFFTNLFVCLFVNVCLASTVLADTFVLNPSYSDEFNEMALDPKWTFVVPVGAPIGQSYSLTENPGFLRMNTIGPTDLWRGVDTTPKVLESIPAGNYQIVVRVLASPDVHFEHAGILVRQDSSDWVRLVRDSNRNSVSLQGSYPDYGGVNVPYSGADVILRLTKNGMNYGGDYSTDGVNFVNVGSLVNPMTPNSIGTTIASTPPGNVFNADFDYFRVFTEPDEISVSIDIKPHRKRNVINPRSKGGVWVAVLSDSEFDPLQMDLSSVKFGPDGAMQKRHRVRDLNKDGLDDLMMRFKIRETGLACGDTEATLMGQTFGSDPPLQVTGTDSIKTVGCRRK